SSREPKRRRHGLLWIFIAAVVVFFAADTVFSYYIDALWFGSLGYAEVFWKTLGLQGSVFAVFAAATFAVLLAGTRLLEPADLTSSGGSILVNGRPIRLPV